MVATFLRREHFRTGAPSSKGWWLTKVNERSRPAIRYWDGEQWSIAYTPDTKADTVREAFKHCASQRAAFEQRGIMWSYSKPRWWLDIEKE